MFRLLRSVLGCGALLTVVIVLGAPASAAERVPERVLVVSAPTLQWRDLARPELTNLRAFVAGAAIASGSTRTGGDTATPGNAYATIGAGGRARAAAGNAGTNLNGDEPYEGGDGAQAFERRTGRPLAAAEVGVLGIDAIAARNDDLPFDTQVGAFGDALQRGGYRVATIANADRALDQPTHREAALAYTDRTGRGVGRVDDSLLVADPAAPFGVAYAQPAVLDAFATQWSDRTVVGVELSDLARAAAAGRGRDAALRASDALFGALMRRVDLDRSLVVVVGPYSGGADPQLTVVAMRGAGTKAGWLVSGTTRRPGYVATVDLAPTVLAQLGLARPSSMEGRSARVVAEQPPLDTRIATLVDANAHAVFRDTHIGQAVDTMMVLTILIALAAAWFLPRGGTGRRAVAIAALTIPGAFLGTYLAMLFPVEWWGTAAYWVIVAVFALGFTAVVELIARGDPWVRTIGAFGALGGFHLVNQVIGGPLEINAVFGYAATYGVRVQGLGNQSYAQLAPCALIVAAMCLVRPAARAGWALALGVLGVTLVVNGAPWWGADFGGLLADVIAFGLFVWIAAGWKVRPRTAVIVGLGAVVLGVVAGLVDLARPAGERTHIGRFFEKIGTDGFGGAATIVERKAVLMAQTFTNLVYVSTLVVVIAVLLWLWFRIPRYGHELEQQYEPMRALMLGFAACGLFGMLLNDSGVWVPGMMAMVVIAAVAALAPVRDRVRDVEPGAEPEETDVLFTR